MLFDITRGEITRSSGADRLATLRAVGAPTGTLHLREPDPDSGLLPVVQDVVDVADFEDAPEGAGGWPVIGWLLNAHLALAPGSGKVYAFDADEETARELHTDVSSLLQVTLQFQRLLEEFTFGDGDGDGSDGDGGEEAGFERLEREVERIREETSRVDPLPFQDDDTVWSVIADEIAEGRRFAGDSPGARSLYG
ncbi:SUKH-4 family immunity protein [Streptomyces sp. NPDC050732]|uniref:SUKH-4 family immunity protein n=1 Tax=Streptomyces sp. NPDC050732 TaxID=3154632 RepID=UPI00342DD492